MNITLLTLFSLCLLQGFVIFVLGKSLHALHWRVVNLEAKAGNGKEGDA